MIVPCSYVVCHFRIASSVCSTRTVRVPPTGPRADECSAASSVLRPVQSVPRLVGALVHRRHRCVSSSLAGDRSGARHLRGNRSGAIPIRCVHPCLLVCQLHLLFCFFSSQLHMCLSTCADFSYRKHFGIFVWRWRGLLVCSTSTSPGSPRYCLYSDSYSSCQPLCGSQ